ncbi:MAG: tripartite tricarboxylate transporter TctB family protein [Burkholderiales bacterium]|nr:tripartite tricarboxylate transporter TctB family protein [Burkholderiales bacterium]
MNENPRRDIPGIAGSAAFIIVGILAFWGARDFSPLGSVFPRTMAVAMIVFAAAYIAMALLRPTAPAAMPAGSPWRRGAVMVVLIAWSFLLGHVGFLTTSVIAYTALLIIANYDRWTPRMAVIYSVVGALVLGGLYWVFHEVLQVPLPAGMLL